MRGCAASCVGERARVQTGGRFCREIRVKFILVDQLISHEPGKKLVMAKNVTMAEEYLADHFPGFPVLPGVMMLEAAVQTAAWLVRQQLNFAHSLVVLKEARGVRYGSFVSPGQTLVMAVDAVEISETRSDFKIKGTVVGGGGDLGTSGGVTAIQARLELAHLNLVQSDPSMGKVDALAIAAQRERWQTIIQRNAAPALAG
jgi:3-hydroxyacyl-[acyl-carrier-protein] dehydratase